MHRIKNSQIPALKKKLVEKQNYLCGMGCGADLRRLPPKDLCLDHDHRAGHVRSVLCRNCNGIEGKIYNLANRGKRASTPSGFLALVLEYWNKHSSPIYPILHPSHKTEDEKRLETNKKARAARARKQALKNLGK